MDFGGFEIAGTGVILTGNCRHYTIYLYIPLAKCPRGIITVGLVVSSTVLLESLPQPVSDLVSSVLVLKCQR